MRLPRWLNRERRIQELSIHLAAATAGHRDALRMYARKCDEVLRLKTELEAKYEGVPSWNLDLEPIKKRAEWMRDNAEQCRRSPGQVSMSGYVAACIDCGRDVPDLIAEVERLRAMVERNPS